MVAVLTERKENEEIGEEGRQKRDLRSENVLEFVQYGDQTLWVGVKREIEKKNPIKMVGFMGWGLGSACYLFQHLSILGEF